MNARHLVRAAVVALLATTGCAGTREIVSSSSPQSHGAVAKTTPVVVVVDDEIASGGHMVWSLPSDGPVDNPVVLEMASVDTYAVVFRQGDAIWVGAIDAAARPLGPLHRVGGHGRWLGAPSARVEGDALLLTWRDSDELKLTVWRPSAAPEAPRVLAVGNSFQRTSTP